MSTAVGSTHVVLPPKPAKSEPQPPPRLWFPITLTVAYWAFYYLGNKLDWSLQEVFLSRMAASAFVLLAGSIWWWANGRIPLFDRFLAFLVFAIGIVITPALLSHPSINGFGMFLFGIPVVFTAATLGLIAARNATSEARRFLVLGAMIVAFLGFAAIRMEGVAGNGDTDFAWRWTNSAETLFLVEQNAQPEQQAVELPHEDLVAGPGDWTEFRGRDRSGSVAAGDVSTDWRKNPPRLVWKKTVGPAWSSVIVVANRVFTQEQRGEHEAVTCYDASSGEELWVSTVKARFDEPVSGPGPRATPTFSEGRLYAFGATGELVCLDASNGKKFWNRKSTEDSQGAIPMWGFAGSPLVTDDLVIVFAGGKKEDTDRKSLLAYQVADGKLAWTADAGYGSFGSPQLSTIGGQKVVTFVGELGLQAFRPESGELVWQFGARRDDESHSLQPHIWSSGELGDRVYLVSSPNVGLVEAQINVVDDKPQLEAGWASKDLKPDFNDFVIHQDHAYGFDREIFACIDLKTGKRTWKGGRYGHGQVILLEDKARLIVLGERGQAVLLSANPAKHEELGKFQALKGKTWNHPVVAGGRLYLRNAEELACYDLQENTVAATDGAAE